MNKWYLYLLHNFCIKADGESEGAVTPDLGVSLLFPRSTRHPGPGSSPEVSFMVKGAVWNPVNVVGWEENLKMQKSQKALTAVGRTCKLHPETPAVGSAVPKHPFKESMNINNVPISDQICFYRFYQWMLRCCWLSSKVKWCNRWGGCRSTSKASTDPISSAISWGQRTVQSCVFGRLKERWEGAKPCRAQPSAGSRRKNEWCSDKTLSKEGSRPNRKTTHENAQGAAYLLKKKACFFFYMNRFVSTLQNISKWGQWSVNTLENLIWFKKWAKLKSLKMNKIKCSYFLFCDNQLKACVTVDSSQREILTILQRFYIHNKLNLPTVVQQLQ